MNFKSKEDWDELTDRQNELRQLEVQQRLSELEQFQNEQDDEYHNRVCYFKTDFKGGLHVPTEIDFHPYLWVGTQKQYDDIYDKYLVGKEGEFKVIGIHKFNTMDEYVAKYPLNKLK